MDYEELGELQRDWETAFGETMPWGFEVGELRPGVGTVGEDQTQPGEPPARLGQQLRRAVAVLQVGRLHLGRDQPPAGVHQDVGVCAP